MSARPASLAPLARRADALVPAGIGLALLTVMVQVRMNDEWGNGALLAASAIPALALLAAGLAAPREAGGAGPAATALLVAGLLCTGIAMARLGDVFAGHDFADHGGWLSLILAIGTAIAAFSAWRARSAVCLFIAALASIGLAASLVHWIFDTTHIDSYRTVFAISFAVLFAAGLAAPGRAGVLLVSAAGAMVVTTAYFLGLFLVFGGSEPWGWELVTLAEGIALAAYAAVHRERGPAYLAFFVLVIFAVSAAADTGSEVTVIDGQEQPPPDQSLLGWPLALAIGTALALVWGLRSRPRH